MAASQGKRAHMQFSDNNSVAQQSTAALVLAITAVVLLIPGTVIDAMLMTLEPAFEALRQWKDSWWPWPVSTQDDNGPALDKLIHFLLFAACSRFACAAWQQTLGGGKVLLLMMSFAVLSEFAQYFIPGRSMSLGDIIADAAGVLTGTGMWLVSRRPEPD